MTDVKSQGDPIVIVGAARTPMGGFQGALKDVAAPRLGAAAINGALRRAGVPKEDVDEVIMGVVLPAGMGQAPARQASRGAGISDAAGCTTVNKMCGSGMKAAMLGHDVILAGSAAVVVAGGMESMSGAPYLLPKARAGYRMGHGEIADHMFLDGLEDAYDRGKLMGCYAEDTATKYQFTREAQDDFAIESLGRARKAIEDGSFKAEVEPVTVKTRRGETVVEQDEQPLKADIEKIRKLKPAFAEDGTVTAANSSSISDGGAALVISGADAAKDMKQRPIYIMGIAEGHPDQPSAITQRGDITTLGTAKAAPHAFGMAGVTHDDIDVAEIYDCFTYIVLCQLEDLGFCAKGEGGAFVDKGGIAPGGHLPVNTNGGGLSYCHPGMYGLLVLIEAARQIHGTCGSRQVDGAHGRSRPQSCPPNRLAGCGFTHP